MVKKHGEVITTAVVTRMTNVTTRRDMVIATKVFLPLNSISKKHGTLITDSTVTSYNKNQCCCNSKVGNNSTDSDDES